MIHQDIKELYEEARQAINRMTDIKSKVMTDDDAGNKRYRQDVGIAWMAVIKLMDDDQHRDFLLTDTKATLSDILENVPEAKAYFEEKISVAAKFKRAKEEMERPFERIEY